MINPPDLQTQSTRCLCDGTNARIKIRCYVTTPQQARSAGLDGLFRQRPTNERTDNGS